MPLVSKPVDVDGYLLLDGGITDPVPLDHMQSLGFDRHVVILTQPKGYRKSPTRGLMLMQWMLRRYPAVAKAMAVRHIRYNRQMDEIRERELAGKVLVIRPPQALGISRTEKDPAELERVYQTGRAEAKKQLERVRKCLEDMEA